jgi:hypothetical protein
MNTIWSGAFWKAAIERAVKSAAQGVILSWGASDSGPANLFDFDWTTAGGFAAGAAALSILMSIVSIPAGGGGPSFGNAETLNPTPPQP